MQDVSDELWSMLLCFVMSSLDDEEVRMAEPGVVMHLTRQVGIGME